MWRTDRKALGENALLDEATLDTEIRAMQHRSTSRVQGKRMFGMALSILGSTLLMARGATL